MEQITYYYRGDVERGIGGGYEWRAGWSETTAEGYIVYPWLTKRECQADAKAKSAKAVFSDVRNPSPTIPNETTNA